MPRRFRQYIAIQLVPSAWLEHPAVGQLHVAVEDADVVEAQETALEDVVAERVLPVDPPVEVQQQLVEHPLEERAVALAGLGALDLVDAQRGPGVHRRDSRRRSSTRTPGSGRWGACTTRAASGRAGPWRTGRRRATSTTQWKARSHAAYQGNSQVSGIDSTSALKMWRQSLLRPVRRASGGGGWSGSPSSHWRTSYL